MYARKICSTTAFCILLISIVMMMPVSIGSDDPCTIRGYVYADDIVIVPDQIILTITGQDIQANTIYPDGYYEITEDMEIGATGTFTVEVNGAPYLALETVTIENGVFLYRIDLTINLPPANSPPYVPTNPSPTGSNVLLDSLLTWDGGDPDGDPVTYDIYFGTASPPLLVNNKAVSSYDPSLSYATTYYWKIIAWDDHGNSNEGSIWSFITMNQPGGGGFKKNEDPVADASESETVGFIEEEIEFDASLSTDSDGIIVNYTWSFGDGTKGYGKVTTHNYSENGTYQVTLKVKDDDGETDEEIFDVVITKANKPPENLVVTGPTSGNQNLDYTYTANATDLDEDDMLRYIFDWGDGETTTSEVVASGVEVTAIHNWSTYGEYAVIITAEDNMSVQISETITVLIDVIVIDDEIKGYLIDEDSNDPFDIFDNSDTDEQTTIEKEDDGTYLIDSDNDGEWDYTYNPDSGVSTYNKYIYDKYEKIFEEQLNTPGFEIISIIAALALVAFILKRRR